MRSAWKAFSGPWTDRPGRGARLQRHSWRAESVIAGSDAFATVELVLAGDGDVDHVIHDVTNALAWEPFSQNAVNFVSALSSLVLRDARFRDHPELVAFGYQMRRKAVEALAPTLRPAGTGGLVRGRGLALHFAPANVDTIFLYSLLLSLLAGNTNIVRISSKKSDQVDLIVDAMRELLARPEHALIRNRIIILRYLHDKVITDALTALCDLRVIWGGDTSVSAIRQSPLPFLARDVVFPDRWSMAVLDAAAFLAASDPSEIARQLVNDAYWFGQMACSSPRLLIWRGERALCEAASDRLVAEMKRHAEAFAENLDPIDYVNKRVFEDASAIDYGARLHSAATSLVSILEIPLERLGLTGQPHVGGGIFLSAHVAELRDLEKLMTRKLQTVVSYGVAAEDWRELLSSGEVSGVDRIVPPGTALDFSPVWDGMSLLREFTRETTIAVAGEVT